MIGAHLNVIAFAMDQIATRHRWLRVFREENKSFPQDVVNLFELSYDEKTTISVAST